MNHVAHALQQVPTGLASAIISAAVSITMLSLASRESRRWRRKEYFLETVQRMNSSPGSRNALLILFHDEAIVPLFADGPDRWQKLTQVEAAQVLVGPASAAKHTDDRQSAIRNSLIDFITQLETIRTVAKTTRIGYSASRDIVGAIGEALSGSAISKRGGPQENLVAAALKWQLEYFDMIDLVLFFRRLGYDIRLTDSDLALLATVNDALLDPRLHKVRGSVLSKRAYLGWLRDLLILRTGRVWRRVRLWSNT